MKDRSVLQMLDDNSVVCIPQMMKCMFGILYSNPLMGEI